MKEIRKEEERVKFIVGLGNPGRKYRWTRHNIGFMVVDSIVSGARGNWQQFHDGELSEVEVDGKGFFLFKPGLFMNCSGKPVKEKMAELDIGTGEILVIYDDFHLDLGTLRLRGKGSSGGHNGLGSIIEALGTDEFKRLRIGIGPAPEGEDAASFVLSSFDSGEKEDVERMIALASEAALMTVFSPFDEVMNRFNGRHLTKTHS